MIVYIFKSIVCSMVFIAIYHLFLENEKINSFKRFYLLSSLILSLLLPVLTITISGEALTTETFYKILANKQISQTTPVQAESVESTPWIFIAWFTYVLITGILLFRFVRNLSNTIKIIKHSKHTFYRNSILIISSHPITPHTFLKYIFLSEPDSSNPKILTHELTHARQWHSIDILLIEIIHCIYWFNPILILFKKAIKLNHEFLADESVLAKESSVLAYQKLLLKKISEHKSTVLASSFNYSIAKKRFTMMTAIKNNKQAAIRITLTLICSLAVSLLIINKIHAQAPAPDEYTVYKDNKWQNLKLTTSAGLQSNEAFLQSIQRDIRYPQAAKTAGVVGDVVVTFEVDTQGKLRNFIVVKKLQEECDAEVIRAIKNSNAVWNIARHGETKYTSRYVFRVTFQLDDLKPSEEYNLSSISAKAINPIVVVSYR